METDKLGHSREVQREVKTYEVERTCGAPSNDGFCTGRMIRDPNAPALLSHPPQYAHCCTKCGRTDRYFKIYPSIVYR